MSGLQCEKRLWLEVHQREVATSPDADAQRRFEVGNAVGAVARELHRGGHLVGFDGGVDGAIAETQDVLNAHPGAPVFEATFAHDDVAVRVDILEKGVRGYRLIEVKSATSVKDEYYPDCAVQAWVLQGNDVTVERVELAHVNNQFCLWRRWRLSRLVAVFRCDGKSRRGKIRSAAMGARFSAGARWRAAGHRHGRAVPQAV